MHLFNIESAEGWEYMINTLVIVGRIAQDPVLKQIEVGTRVSRIVLAVSRSFKNMKGEYETDFIPVVLWDALAESTCQYCKKGDIVGVRGRIQVRKNEVNVAKGDEVVKQKFNQIEAVAERVIFIHSGHKKDKFENQVENDDVDEDVEASEE